MYQHGVIDAMMKWKEKMDLLKNYFKLQQEIFDYFGYVEDWVTIPLHDLTDVFWNFDGETVKFVYDETAWKKEDYYEYVLYRQRFLPKWVYETNDYTMICVDTQVDGNKYLAIFDNKMRTEDIYL